jgi:MoaA/NifB/PqqE/SkfB family radical SAM enzyme
MKIISVDNNWNQDTLRIDINLGNICNYKCWYCWPGSNAGTDYWPNLEILQKNILILMQYYRKNSNKKIFDFHFVGGEPTHWTKLLDFIKFLKSNSDCLISMTSNGSKKIDYWKQISPYFDRVTLSYHHQFVNKETFRDICDLLYEANVMISVSVMMDPNSWDKCIEGVEFLKKSKRTWTIRYVELIGDNFIYTPEQTIIIKKHRARRCNLFWFFKNNKHYHSKVIVRDSDNKKHKFQDNEILIKKLNHFKGWKCSVGVDWIHIQNDGKISGTCNQLLFGEKFYYNLYSENFEKEFNPTLVYATCDKVSCLCNIETIMPKYLEKSY